LDLLDGGAGADTADFSTFGQAVRVDIAAGTARMLTNAEVNGGQHEHEDEEHGHSDQGSTLLAWLTGIENVIGTRQSDQLSGDQRANRLVGGGGDDRLEGGAGDDTLVGGAGADRLTGGSGRDRFEYANVNERGDTITDFARGRGGDVLDLSDVLVGYHPGSSALSQFVRLSQHDGSTFVSVNADGVGNDFVVLVMLQGVTGVTLNALVTDGNLLA
jgi:Ca2+-binding RTX toxin-like protein